MFVLKISPCSRAEWSELSCKTQPFETVTEKYSSSDDSTILLTDEIDRYFTLVTTKTSSNYQLFHATAATKKKDIATKSLRTGSLRSAVSGRVKIVEKTPVSYLPIMKSRLLRAVIVM